MAASGTLKSSTYTADETIGERGIKFYWTSSQDTEQRITTVSWTLSGYGGDSSYYYKAGNFTVTINGTAVYTSTERIKLYNQDITSGTIQIPHNSDGTASMVVHIEAGVYEYAVNVSGDKTFALNPINPSTITVASSVTTNIYTDITINTASTNYTHTITCTVGDQTQTIVSKTSDTTISWRPYNSLCTAFPNATSATATITCETFSGSTSLGKTQKTITVVAGDAVVPSVSFTLTDPTGTYDKASLYLQTLSQIKITTTSSGSQGSTIRLLKITAGDWINTEDFTTPVLSTSGNFTVTATVTDSRGRTATTTQTITVTAYSAPSVTAMSVQRADSSKNPDNEGAYGLVTFSAVVTNLTGYTNTPTYTLYYRQKGASDWSEKTISTTAYTITNGITTFSADTDKSYECKIKIADQLTESTTSPRTLGSVFKLIQFTKGGTGIALGGIASKASVFEVNLTSVFNGAVQGTALGLGQLPQMATGDDFNDYTTPGAWGRIADSTAKNAPSTLAGVLYVANGTGAVIQTAGFIRQMFIPYTADKIYMRYMMYANSTWTVHDWKSISFS